RRRAGLELLPEGRQDARAAELRQERGDAARSRPAAHGPEPPSVKGIALPRSTLFTSSAARPSFAIQDQQNDLRGGSGSGARRPGRRSSPHPDEPRTGASAGRLASEGDGYGHVAKALVSWIGANAMF